jgi:hypothetical protein
MLSSALRDSAKVDLADTCTQFLDTATDGVPLTSAEEDGKAGHAIGPVARAYDEVIWVSVRAPPAEYLLPPY